MNVDCSKAVLFNHAAQCHCLRHWTTELYTMNKFSSELSLSALYEHSWFFLFRRLLLATLCQLVGGGQLEEEEGSSGAAPCQWYSIVFAPDWSHWNFPRRGMKPGIAVHMHVSSQGKHTPNIHAD